MIMSQTAEPMPFRVILKAEREVAFKSPDHLMPWGTKQDNSVNRRFNDKVYKLYPRQEQLKVLDMGCSGGGFVKSCFDEGCLAVGLEGSDFSKRRGRAEWRSIPEYLFTCDVTGKFEIFLEKSGVSELLQFDVVTCWEMMEHIAEADISKVAANVKRHLAPGGIWIMSVSPNVQYFNTQFVRGPKYNGPGSFHLVLSGDKSRLPAIPQERWLRRLHDLWIGSLPQKVLAGTY